MSRQVPLTKKVILSGISKIAIPNRKDKDDIEFQLGTVLVLHLQCKNIAFMSVGALDPFQSLKNLYLYKNNIRRIQGLDYLFNLELLDLSRNNIERIDNLDKCTKLKKLYLGFNEVQIVEGLEGLQALEEFQIDDQDIPPGQPLIFSPGIMASVFHTLVILDISSNLLPSLLPIINLPRLETLDASMNCLTDMEDAVSVLQTLYQLRNLRLKGNPIAKKPTYKPSVIGAVYRLEVLDDKEINDTVRNSIQKLRMMKEYRTRKQQQEKSTFEDESYSVDENPSAEFSFSTPTSCMSPLSGLHPPPMPFKIKKQAQGAPSRAAINRSGKRQENVSGLNQIVSDPSFHTMSRSHSSSNAIYTENSMYTRQQSTIGASEFKHEFSLDDDDEGMSDMAKIIFRLSNMDEGGGDAKSFHSSYWDIPGSSMIRECAPLSPLQGVDLAEPLQIPHHTTESAPALVGTSTAKDEKRSNVTFRPKPASPGGRRCSNNINSSTSKSAPDLARSAEDDYFLQQSQPNYVYGRTLSPLIELPTPESSTATARTEYN